MGRIIELHGRYYGENWGLDLYFEVDVARGLCTLMHDLDAARDGAWFAQVDDRTVGAIFINGPRAVTEAARLRFFIVDPAYQGVGIGKKLMQAAMNFCREKGFARVRLTTFAGLDAAIHLYERHGFEMIEESGSDFSGNDSLQKRVYICELDDASA